MRITAAVVVVLAVAGPVSAQTLLGPVGSTQGTAFQDACDSPTAMYVRAGWWIDGIRLDCVGSGRPLRGGSGGEEQVFRLQPGERIVAISGSVNGAEGPYVYSISIETNQRTSPVYGNGGPNRGQMPFRFEVPMGQRFGGWFGTYGEFLHSFGVIAVAAVASPSPKPLTGGAPAAAATPRTPIDVPSSRMGCPSNGRRCQGMRAGDEWEGSAGGVSVTGAEAVGSLRSAPLFACRVYFEAPSPYYYSSVFGYVAEGSGCVVNDGGAIVIGQRYEVFLRNPAERTTSWIAERGGTFSLYRIGICRVTAANGVIPGHIVEGRGCAVVVNGGAVMADGYETMSVR